MSSLSGITISEYFLVERSKEGKYFEAIGTVKAAGTSMQRHDYTYIDALPFFSGSSYYRFRQVGFDGISTNSKLCFIEGVDQEIIAYLNPMSNYVTIKMNGDAIASVAILNEIGYLVPIKRSEHAATIDITSLPSGIYMMEVQQQSGTTVHKIVVEK